jgi:ribonuclease P protein component
MSHQKARWPFDQSYRLHDWKDFQRFFEGSEVLRLRGATVFRKENAYGHLRLGFTIKGKPTAVTRNAFKRIIREHVRLNQHALGKFDYNLVVNLQGSQRAASRALAGQVALQFSAEASDFRPTEKRTRRG